MPHFTVFEWIVLVLLMLLIGAVYRAADSVSRKIGEKADEILRELETPESIRQEYHDEQQALLDEDDAHALTPKVPGK